MNSHSIENIHNRLLKLEKQHRRLKQLGAAALVVAAALLVMAQASPKKTIEANEFILRDNSGNVRARLSMNAAGSPELLLLDELGKTRLELDAGVGKMAFLGGGVRVFDGQGRERGVFSADDYSGAFLSLLDLKGRAGEGTSSTVLAPGLVSAFDEQGFSALLGVQSLETPSTGETHKTSAASLVLYDKNKKVIWKAP